MVLNWIAFATLLYFLLVSMVIVMRDFIGKKVVPIWLYFSCGVCGVITGVTRWILFKDAGYSMLVIFGIWGMLYIIKGFKMKYDLMHPKAEVEYALDTTEHRNPKEDTDDDNNDICPIEEIPTGDILREKSDAGEVPEMDSLESDSEGDLASRASDDE